MRRALLLSGTVALCLLTPALAPAIAWDQTQVNDAAQQLDKAMRRLVTTARASSPRPGNEELYEAFMGDLKVAQEKIAELVGLLEAGGGREETEPTFRSIQEVGRRGMEKLHEARPDTSADRQVQPVSGLMWKLAAFYDAEAE